MELVALFSNIIPRKRVLDAGQLFLSSHVWNDRLSFHRKFYRVKGRLLQQNLTFDHLYLLTPIYQILTNRSRLYVKARQDVEFCNQGEVPISLVK